MSDTPERTPGLQPSRRTFLKETGKAAAAGALAGVVLPHVHAAQDSTIRLAIVGAGSRGSGAVANALSAPGGPVKLVAMADLFESRLETSYKALSDEFGKKVEVPKDQKFLGFDAYKRAMECLRPGQDVVLLTTHAAFRPTHLEHAVEKGLNVFMEKTFAPDPGGIQQVLRAGEAAEKKGLKIAAGLMCRHSPARQALIQKIRDGELGPVNLIRAYRMDSGARMGPFQPGKTPELLWQIQRPYFFLWASSGLFIELMIHQIDECCWIKDGWPVAAHGLGGRAPGSTDASQNLDTYGIEYTFADGAKAFVQGRYIPGTQGDFATYLHGTKKAAQFSGNVHAGTVHTYKDQVVDPKNIDWRAPKEAADPWQMEWNNLLESVRQNRPHNEARRAALSNLAAIMGRAAVHTGKTITWEQAVASTYKFYPNAAGLTADSPAPVQANKDGKYPVPVPGAWAEV